MTSNYTCKKCLHKTNNYNDLKRHLTKKNQCIKNLDTFSYSDDQLIILSLLPNCSEKDVEHLQKSNIIYKNKDRLFQEINYIDKNKLKICSYCKEQFNKICDLRKHILITCFYKELEKINSPNIINITNNNVNIINNNITNIYYDGKAPIPFDNSWDISHIAKFIQNEIIFSNFMYSELLKEIINNNFNLNVIIDKNTDSGMVYKNDIDKYIHMKSKDIVDNTMDKLKNHLLDINNNAKDKLLLECLNISKKIIESKHENYKNNETLQQSIKDLIATIYETQKDKAIDISSNIMKNIHKGY